MMNTGNLNAFDFYWVKMSNVVSIVVRLSGILLKRGQGGLTIFTKPIGECLK